MHLSNSLLLVVSVEATQITGHVIATVQENYQIRGGRRWFVRAFLSPVLVRLVCCYCLRASWIDRPPVGSPGIPAVQEKSPESEVPVGLCWLSLANPAWFAWFAVAVCGPLGLIVVQWTVLASLLYKARHQFGRRHRLVRAFRLVTIILGRRKLALRLHHL